MDKQHKHTVASIARNAWNACVFVSFSREKQRTKTLWHPVARHSRPWDMEIKQPQGVGQTKGPCHHDMLSCGGNCDFLSCPEAHGLGVRVKTLPN